jgi:hypothetical protein
MKTKTLLLLFTLFFASSLRAQDDTPVPPEVQKLVETLVAAFKSADDAAMLACWHTPEALAEVKRAQAAADASTSPTPIDSAKEGDRELRRRIKDNTISTARAAELRALITKHFGDVAMLALVSVELDEDDEAPAEIPAYDDVDIRFRAADGSALKIGVDSLWKINGVWKFKGRLEDDLTIELPEIK